MRFVLFMLFAFIASGSANSGREIMTPRPMKNEAPMWLTFNNCTKIGSFLIKWGKKDGMKHALEVNDYQLEFFNSNLYINHKGAVYIIEIDTIAKKVNCYRKCPYTSEDVRRVDNMIKDLLIRFEGQGLIDTSHNPSAITDEILRYAQEFRQLRKIKGHFAGGEWNDDVDKHGGRLYTAMNDLKNRLDGRVVDRNEIIKLMGEPDAIRPSEKGESLIYFWRGWHDYLFFECHEFRVQRIEWYFALE